jgi:GR25 family glycosyltransferase involved in LPS biosynthesis
MNSDKIQKFIIYLKRDKKRKIHLVKNTIIHLNNYMFFEGIDWKDCKLSEYLKEKEIKINDKFLKYVYKGQIGCYLSHYYLWEFIVKSKIAYSIIFEDDVTIDKDFNQNLDKILTKMPDNLEYLYFYIHPYKQNKDYLKENEYRILKSGENWGTVAYLITLEGAKKLLKYTKLMCGPIDRQINYIILKERINGYMLNKSLVNTCGIVMKNVDTTKYFQSNIWTSEKYKISQDNKEKIL